MDLILTFHSLDSSDSVLSYDPSRFRELIEGLVEDGVAFVSLDELMEQRSDPQRHRVVLTFDDGFRSVHEHALPVLEELELPSVLYVVSDWVGKANTWPSQPSTSPTFDLMNWDEIRELQAAGCTIGSHSSNHVHVEQCSPSELDSELANSRKYIEDRVQHPVQHFCYPYGTYNSQCQARVGAHYTTATTTDMRPLRTLDPALRLPRIDSYYLRNPSWHRPLCGVRAQTYLRMRAILRNAANHLRR